MSARNNKFGANAVYLTNSFGSQGGIPTLGDAILEPKNLQQDNVDQTYTNENFNGLLAYTGITGTGGVATGATGESITVIAESGNIFEYFVLGAGQTIRTFPKTSTGIDVTLDAVDDEGIELHQGVAAYSKHAKVIGTDAPFFMQAKISVADVSVYDECMFGFRAVEACDAALGTYTDYCTINSNIGTVNIDTAVGAADVVTACTDAITDGQYLISRLEYDETVGLTKMCALANEMTAAYVAHCADVTMHTTAADATNVITAPAATDLTTLIALITDQQIQYDAHEGDSELAATWLYHAAQETGDDSLTDTTAPTTLALCGTRLNDFRAHYILHEADATSHALQDLHTPSLGAAGSMTLKVGANTTTLTEVSTNPGYTFTAALTVVPFFRQLHTASAASVLSLQNWEVGLL